MARCAAEAARDKKAKDILILDLRSLDALTDFFVICTGDVDPHVKAIAEYIEIQVKKTTSNRLLHREGMESLNWVLLDYIDVVVHIFKPRYRDFYRLEDLWADASALAVGDETDLKNIRTLLKPSKRTVRRRALGEQPQTGGGTKESKPDKSATRKKAAPR